VWFLVQWQPTEQPEPTPIPPGPAPVTQPDRPTADAAGNPIQLYRDVQQLVAFAQRVQSAVEAASRELSQARIRDVEPVVQTQRIVPPRWQPTERQAVLYFHGDDATLHTKAASLMRQGHPVYRAGSHRSDLYQQYDVRTTPVWLVIRDGRVIYRSHRAPRFIDVAPVRQAPTYQAPPVRYYRPPVYRGGFSCVGGGC